jgi:cell division protein ZipA
LLGKLDLPARSPATGKEEEYLPSDTVGWVVTIEFPGKPSLDPKKVDGVFDEAWRKKFGGFTCYCRDADTGRWTFAISADGPRAITEVKLEWSYVPFGDDAPSQTERLYEERLTEIAVKLKAFGESKLKASRTPSEAAQRAKHLRELKAKLDRSAVIILKAPQGQRFEGKKIWDVMLCLGLKWGDMDCFHWVNPSDEGEDYLFSVETSTLPGYFLPEEIAADRVNVEDLVFVFSIPRSPAPLQVFDSMAKAVEYSQKRLGGQIVDEFGSPANLAEMRRQIMEVERQLRDAGFAPGKEGTLRLF